MLLIIHKLLEHIYLYVIYKSLSISIKLRNNCHRNTSIVP